MLLINSIFTKGYIIPGFIVTFIFLMVFKKSIRKNPVVFYTIFAVTTLIVCKFFISKTLLGYTTKTMDPNIMYWINMYKRGVTGFMLFLTVMFLGVLDKKNRFVAELYSIRGPLSIIASISSVCHLVIYGYSYIARYFAGKIPDGLYTFLFTTSSVLFAILIPLFITSFMKVRRKMNPLNWKKLQKWAYGFYFILFINVITVFIRRFFDDEFVLKSDKGISTVISLIVYSFLFISYGILLRRKFKVSENIEKVGNDKISNIPEVSVN